MKRLFTTILAVSSILLGSCGSQDVKLNNRYHCLNFYVNRDDPRNTTVCEIQNDITLEKWFWEGVINTWIPDVNLNYSFGGYLFEYSNGTYTMIYGLKK